MSNNWIALGGSENAPDMFRQAVEDYSDAVTITTNSGIKLIKPDYYFLSDQIACQIFGAQAKEYQAAGMKIITLQRKHESLVARKLDHADIFVKQVHSGCPLDVTPDAITDCMFSGLYCAQYALRNGAEVLALPGHEGYPLNIKNNPKRCYWDDSTPVAPVTGDRHTKEFIGPWWRKIIKVYSNTVFHFYGDLNFEIDGPNVRKTPAYASQNA
jgi:hypothetical protein